MSRKTTILALAAFGALTLGAVAVAQNAYQTAAQAPQAGHGFDPAARFAARDANHDGFIDKSEASGRMLKHFDDIDTDHDSRISQGELGAHRQARLAQAGGEGGQAGWRHHRHHGFGGGDRFAMMDADHDGKLTFAEMTARARDRFDRLDANHDGVLVASEMPKRGDHKKWRHGDGTSGAGR